MIVWLKLIANNFSEVPNHGCSKGESRAMQKRPQDDQKVGEVQTLFTQLQKDVEGLQSKLDEGQYLSLADVSNLAKRMGDLLSQAVVDASW